MNNHRSMIEMKLRDELQPIIEKRIIEQVSTIVKKYFPQAVIAYINPNVEYYDEDDSFINDTINLEDADGEFIDITDTNELFKKSNDMTNEIHQTIEPSDYAFVFSEGEAIVIK